MSDSSNTSSNYSCPEFNDMKIDLNYPHYCQSSFDSKQQLFSSSSFTRDQTYLEKRRKNNAAAKRSREKRRQQDMKMEIQIQQLQQEKVILQQQIHELKQIIEKFITNPSNMSIISLDNGLISRILSDAGIDKTAMDISNINNSNNNNIPSSNINVKDSLATYPRPLDLTVKTHDRHLQMSPDSSFSLPTNFNKFHSRIKSKNDIQDERYLDRRRRNNEAVRKCRRNKKVKMLNEMLQKQQRQINTSETLPPNNILQDQLPPKLQREPPIAQDIELTNQHISSAHIKSESTLDSMSQPIRKPMKWKNKLIEANKLNLI